MPDKSAEQILEGLIDALAAIEHERWGHWQSYVHAQAERCADGALKLPTELVARWERQIDTPFHALTEAEKRSDREQVRRYLPLIVSALSGSDADDG